jgi:GntR family transcriptional regulator
MAEPLYRQIAEDLRSKIEDGELARGAQLPTEIELGDRYYASRNTVRDAIKWLIARGLVETRPDRGTFVAEENIPFVTTLTGDPETALGGGEDDIYELRVKATQWVPTASVPRVEIQQASGFTASELGVETGSAVVSRHRERFIDGAPWMLQTSFYPARFVEQGAFRLTQPTDIPKGTASYLRETVGVDQTGWRDMIVVRAPNQVETNFFKLPDDGGIPVIESWRTTFDSDGSPIRLTVSVYPADRNSPFHYEEPKQVQSLAFLRALIRIRSQQKRGAEIRSLLSSLQSDPLSRQTSARDRMKASSHSVRGPTFPAAFWPTRGTAIAA